MNATFVLTQRIKQKNLYEHKQVHQNNEISLEYRTEAHAGRMLKDFNNSHAANYTMHNSSPKNTEKFYGIKIATNSSYYKIGDIAQIQIVYNNLDFGLYSMIFEINYSRL